MQSMLRQDTKRTAVVRQDVAKKAVQQEQEQEQE